MNSEANTNNELYINNIQIQPDSRILFNLPVAELYTHTPLSLPIQVINGKKSGPRLFVSAAIHGDELNGVEIIRRLLMHSALRKLQGTLIAIPIVNIYGLLNNSRYLPDRRDLNRSFPGSETGSLAARLAHQFMNEIVTHCTHGIDLHTGALHRVNLPQIRAKLDDPETERLAHAFGVPVILNSTLRDGSLREAAAEQGIPMLLYEAGEALRFDELSIRAGVRGIIAVMRALGMLPSSRRKKSSTETVIAHSSLWIRAPQSGIFRNITPLGNRVRKDEPLGIISDPFGKEEIEVCSSHNGIVIGRNNLPLVNEGDALFHIARFQSSREVAEQVEAFQAEQQNYMAIDNDPLII